MLITYVFHDALKMLLPGNYSGFISGFYLALFIILIWPAIFSLLPGKKRTIMILAACLIPFLPVGINLSCADQSIAVIGHRGFAAAAPENTIPSFKKAIEQGVDYIELDVQLSSDRQIIVCHDGSLLRTTGVDADVSSLSLEELKKLDAGSWFSSEFAGTEIPTLEEVLDLIKPADVKLYLELKDIGEDELFPVQVLEMVTEKEMLDRTIFASFQYN